MKDLRGTARDKGWHTRVYFRNSKAWIPMYLRTDETSFERRSLKSLLEGLQLPRSLLSKAYGIVLRVMLTGANTHCRSSFQTLPDTEAEAVFSFSRDGDESGFARGQ